MQIVDLHEAKKHLSTLVEQAAQGEPCVIAKVGRPLVQVVPLNGLAAVRTRRVGFLAAQVKVPDDFDRMGTERIETLFEDDRNCDSAATSTPAPQS